MERERDSAMISRLPGDGSKLTRNDTWMHRGSAGSKPEGASPWASEIEICFGSKACTLRSPVDNSSIQLLGDML